MLDWSIRRNTSLSVLDKLLSAMGLVDRRKERALTRDYVRKLNVATDSIDKRVINLSGGNQQKVVVAKWLATGPRPPDPERPDQRRRHRRQGGDLRVCVTSLRVRGWLSCSPPRRSRRRWASAIASWSSRRADYPGVRARDRDEGGRDALGGGWAAGSCRRWVIRSLTRSPRRRTPQSNSTAVARGAKPTETVSPGNGPPLAVADAFWRCTTIESPAGNSTRIWRCVPR